MARSSLPRAVAAEFLGTLVFQLLGGSTDYAPFHGIILAVVIYMTAATSGGVVNPAVAACLLAVGELSLGKFAAYVAAQLSGAVVGALIAAVADPDYGAVGGTPRERCSRVKVAALPGPRLASTGSSGCI